MPLCHLLIVFKIQIFCLVERGNHELYLQYILLCACYCTRLLGIMLIALYKFEFLCKFILFLFVELTWRLAWKPMILYHHLVMMWWLCYFVSFLCRQRKRKPKKLNVKTLRSPLAAFRGMACWVAKLTAMLIMLASRAKIIKIIHSLRVRVAPLHFLPR